MAKISDSNIVSTNKRVMLAGDPNIIWYDPSEIIIVGEDSEYDSTGVRSGSLSINNSGSLLSSSSSPEKNTQAISALKAFELPDVPQPSDIESIEYVKYFDPVSKIEKAKAIIKIRNSSRNRNNVSGVDARIYQPRGI